MKKMESKNVYILAIALLIILLGFLFLNFLQKPSVPIPEQQIRQLLSPLLQETYLPPLSLQNISFYQAGFTPSETLNNYVLAFTNDNDFTDVYQPLIHFQQGLNGISLNSALNIDNALAESLADAAEEVRIAGMDNKEACSYFNSLLNPSLLVMDLTLWGGKSQLFPVTQKYRDVGIQCLQYFEVLNHGMLVYDPRTGKMLQKSVFCTPEEKSICFNSWIYFWRFATERKEAPANIGTCSSLADWMMQGFVCINGVDLEENRLIKNVLPSKIVRKLHINMLPPHEHVWITIGELKSPSSVEGTDVKDSFQNALGANGKTIIDNVKRKCAQVQEKTNKYTSLLPVLTSSSTSPTGSVVSIGMVSSNSEELQEEYEKAMLFASLFSEACIQNPKDFVADLGDGATGTGLNKAKACLLDGIPGSNSKVKCVDAFRPGRRLGVGSTAGGAAPDADHPGKRGVPDQNCKVSEVIDKSIDTRNVGRAPTANEKKRFPDAGNFRVANPQELSKFLNDNNLGQPKDRINTRAISQWKEVKIGKKSEQAAPTVYKEGYLNSDTVRHENWHGACPQCTEQQVQQLEDNEIEPPKTTVTPQQAAQMCKECTTFPENQQQQEQQPKKDQAGQPEAPESDKCSAQAQRLETFSNCIDEKEGAQKVTVKEGSTDPLGPDSEMYGGSARTCEQVAAGGGGYFGVKPGAIDCEQSQQAAGCDFIGIVYLSSGQGLFSKKCQQVQEHEENNLGLQCPSIFD